MIPFVPQSFLSSGGQIVGFFILYIIGRRKVDELAQTQMRLASYAREDPSSVDGGSHPLQWMLPLLQLAGPFPTFDPPLKKD